MQILCSIHSTDEQPKFDKQIILFTNKGVTLGRLVRIDHSGKVFSSDDKNQVYWSSFRVLFWMDIPDNITKIKQSQAG